MWDDRIIARRGMTWDKLIIAHLESRGIDGAFYQDWARHEGGFVVTIPPEHLMIYPQFGNFIVSPVDVNKKGSKTAGRIEDPDFLDNLDKALEYYGVELLYE